MKQLNWYQIFGKSNIPDGRTVLPTDDIQIWLNCANIWDKTYTTLAEVLADADTLSALIASNNAVDYMVRSTTWTVSASVPKMTGYTTPSGVVSASHESTNPDLTAWHAFADLGSDSYAWSAGAGGRTANEWIQYEFTSAVAITSVELRSGDGRCKNFKVQGSNDGFVDDSHDLMADIIPNDSNTHVFSFANSTAYKYYRVFVIDVYDGAVTTYFYKVQFYSIPITANATAMTLIGANNYCANTLLADSTWCEAICNSEYFESVLNVKVPKMTSNTTPSGECFGSSYFSAGYEYYRAFDESTADEWYSSYGAVNNRIGYNFGSKTRIYKVHVRIRQYAYSGTIQQVNYTVQGTDNDTWEDIATFVTPATPTTGSSTYVEKDVVTNGEYKKFCIYTNDMLIGSNGLENAFRIIQFYGRVDV